MSQLYMNSQPFQMGKKTNLNWSEEKERLSGIAGNEQEGQHRHHYRLIPDGFSSVVDIEGNESDTQSHRFSQGRKTHCIKQCSL